MRAIRSMALPLVVGWLAVACGGSDTTDGGDAETGVTLEELPAKYGAALCDVFSSCAGDLLAIFRPGEDCSKTTQVTVEESLSPLKAAIDAGRIKYHPSRVQACLDDLTAAGCDQLDRREPASCRAAVEGTIAEGDECTIDAECAGEQFCKVGDACPGKCAAFAAAGEACLSNDHCKSGLACDDNGHCVAPARLDELCKQGEPDCGPGLLCLGDDATAKTPGRCFTVGDALAGKLGDACAFGDGTLCAIDYACEIRSVAPLSGECVAKVAANAECHAAIPDECPVDQYCKLGANPLDPGVCTDKPSAGERCTKGLVDANVCAPYARCDDGTCRDIAHAGEDCHADETCYSGRCVDGACVTGSSCE